MTQRLWTFVRRESCATLCGAVIVIVFSKAIDAASDLACVDVGDARLTVRLTKIAETMAARPKASLPDAFDEAGLEGVYRFMSNPAVGFDRIVEAQTKQTASRCGKVPICLVVHDTTELAFELREDCYRTHLSRISSSRQGFFLHASIALSGDGSLQPLGLVAGLPYVHAKGVAHDAESKRYWEKRGGLFENEGDRWLDSVTVSETVLAETGSRVVHVADREGDSFGLFGALVQQRKEFVIRLAQDRKVEGDGVDVISDAVSTTPFLEGTREIEISKRTPSKQLSARKAHPARRGRKVLMSFRRAHVTIPRPSKRANSEHLPSKIKLTVVEAVERNPPPGEEKVRWLLLTSEPCDDLDDVLRVVDWYRARWVIEEYFKAIKTGCSYELRQFAGAHPLLNMLGVTLALAMQALELRSRARVEPDAPATQVLSRGQIALLVALVPKHKLKPDATAHQALMAIATLGGHLKRNGPPGWLVLYRGYTRLRDAETVWHAMQAAEKM